VFETRLQTQKDLDHQSAESRLQSVLVEKDFQPLFKKPFDVAARQGLVVVSDSAAALVHVFDVPRRRVFSFGWRGEGRLKKPLGVAIDEQSRIYVADVGRGLISVFDRFGYFLRFIGAAGDFDRLSDVAVSADGQRIYALDRGGVQSIRHQITVFNAEGEQLSIVGGRGHEAGQLNHPSQIDVASNGDLWVLDAGNFRVQHFSASGEFIHAWGKAGRFMGQFARPRGLAVSADGLVFVSDAAFQNVQIFDQQGSLLLDVGAQQGSDAAKFVLPSGLAVDETGRLYVVDQYLNKVEVLRMLNPAERASHTK
jgi:DNA-binding beta-propeller fold protein YncE